MNLKSTMGSVDVIMTGLRSTIPLSELRLDVGTLCN